MVTWHTVATATEFDDRDKLLCHLDVMSCLSLMMKTYTAHYAYWQRHNNEGGPSVVVALLCIDQLYTMLRQYVKDAEWEITPSHTN